MLLSSIHYSDINTIGCDDAPRTRSQRKADNDGFYENKSLKKQNAQRQHCCNAVGPLLPSKGALKGEKYGPYAPSQKKNRSNLLQICSSIFSSNLFPSIVFN